MAKSWKDIFADKSIADNHEIVIVDSKVTLGELRAFDAEQKGQVAKELQRATEMQAKLEQDQVQAATLLAELANQRLPAPAPQPAAPTNTQPDYESDPILRPLYQQVKQALDSVNGLKESLTNELSGLKKTVQTAQAYYVNDDWKRNFDSMPERNDPVLKPIIDKITLKDALRYAGEHKINDYRDVPDPVAAVRQMTEQQRIEAIAQAKFEAGKQEGIQLGRKQQFAEMPKPGVTGRRVAEVPHKNMDEAINALRNDPDMQEQLAGIHGVQ